MMTFNGHLQGAPPTLKLLIEQKFLSTVEIRLQNGGF